MIRGKARGQPIEYVCLQILGTSEIFLYATNTPAYFAAASVMKRMFNSIDTWSARQ
jgi:hypothetical protein